MPETILNPKVINGRCPSPSCGLKFGEPPSLAYVIYLEGKDYNPNCKHCSKRCEKELPGTIL